jgi:hypothetical protein
MALRPGSGREQTAEYADLQPMARQTHVFSNALQA